MDCTATLLAGGGLAPGCAGALLSKVLGYAVVAGSAALKLPQVRVLSVPLDLSSVTLILGPRCPVPGRASRLDDAEEATGDAPGRQIANVLASKRADGLSRASLEAETLGYFVSLAYRYAEAALQGLAKPPAMTRDCPCARVSSQATRVATVFAWPAASLTPWGRNAACAAWCAECLSTRTASACSCSFKVS